MRRVSVFLVVNFAVALCACEEEPSDLPKCDFSENCYNLDNQCSGDDMYYICNTTGYECLWSCEDMCASSGNLYSGDCGFSAESNGDVCYCIPSDQMCTSDVTCRFWDFECQGNYIGVYCHDDMSYCYMSCDDFCATDGLTWTGGCGYVSESGFDKCYCE